MQTTKPPLNEAELLMRCQHMAGLSLQELANRHAATVPQTLHHAKGWIGQLIECYLGASANNQALPDFADLGIELKTVPIHTNGKPLASTYICTAPLSLTYPPQKWQTSWIRKKLTRVLWVPIEADPNIPLTDRKIGNALLWQLSEPFDHVLQQDWEELMEHLQLGHAPSLSAYQGTYLQIRPKAAHSRVQKTLVDSEGEVQHTVPKGFYLRREFTERIFSENYLYV